MSADVEVPHSVGVFEIADVVERRKPRKPNLVVVAFPSASSGDVRKMLRGKKTALENLVRLRTDLADNENFPNRKSAIRRRNELAKQLAIRGFTVNPDPRKTCRVYVLELRPKREGDLRVYVGQTSKEVDVRIAEHLAGGKTSSRKVRNGFVVRRADLETPEVFHSTWDAEAEETWHGLTLRAMGFKVAGPQGMSQDADA